MQVNWIVNKDNIHIVDSYRIKDEVSMAKVLSAIRQNTSVGECAVIYNREFTALIEEWKAHNLLYNLHLFRTHTKDVDLDSKGGKYQLIWKILSWLY